MLSLYFLVLIVAPLLSFASPGYGSRGQWQPQVARHGMFQNRPTRRSSSFGRRAPIAPRQASSPGACASGSQLTTKAPKTNIFAGLTDDEAAAVTSFLHGQNSLNLTAAATATR